MTYYIYQNINKITTIGRPIYKQRDLRLYKYTYKHKLK